MAKSDRDMKQVFHFLELAVRGQAGAASDGERRAADLLDAVLHNVAGLDHDAVIGLCRFVAVVAVRHQIAEAMVAEVSCKFRRKNVLGSAPSDGQEPPLKKKG